MRRPIVFLSAVVLGALAIGACGDDDEPSAAGGGPSETSGGAGDGSSLEVVAHDIRFDAERYEVAAGPVEVRYRNEGSINHTLVIEGVDGFELEVTSNGDVDEGTVELEADTYTIYCSVPGHREAGMEATLVVDG